MNNSCTKNIVLEVLELKYKQLEYSHNSWCVLIVLEVLELSVFIEGGVDVVLLMTIKERSMSNASSNNNNQCRTDEVLSRQ